MDPYLEPRDFWPEVHSRLIAVLADFLVPRVRPKYRVAIEKRVYEITLAGQVAPTDYRILASAAEQRPRAAPYGFGIRDRIPAFALTLRPEDPALTIDLQTLLAEVYDRSGYDYTLDYAQSPSPPFAEADQDWAAKRLSTLGADL
jgi:hypothetical protein